MHFRVMLEHCPLLSNKTIKLYHIDDTGNRQQRHQATAGNRQNHSHWFISYHQLCTRLIRLPSCHRRRASIRLRHNKRRKAKHSEPPVEPGKEEEEDITMNGLGSPSHHSSSNNMNTNVSLTTSYDVVEAGVVTVAQKRQREHNLAMKKAEAVTSRYSSICGLDMTQLPVTAQRHRSNSAAAAAASNNASSHSNSNTNATANGNGNSSHHHHNKASKSKSPGRKSTQQQLNTSSSSSVDGDGSGEQPRRRSRRASTEPDYLALNRSFRKSFSSIASGDLPVEEEGATSEKRGGIPPPPPLQTEVTDLLLTPQQERKQQQQTKSAERPYDESPYSSTRRPTQNDDTLQSPPPAASPPQSSSFHASLFPPQQHYTTAYPSPESVLDVRSGHQPSSLISSTTMTIDDQAQLLREIQEQHQRQQQQQQGLPGGSSMFTPDLYTTNTRRKPQPTAIQEQEELWRELSLQHQRQLEQQQQRYLPPPAAAAAAAASTPIGNSSNPLSPQEEQAQLWAQIQQQQQQHQRPPEHFQYQQQSSMEWGVASLPSSAAKMTPLEEQAHLLAEIQKQNHHQNTGYPSGSALAYNAGMGPAHAGMSAVEEQARMLRALELQRNARGNMVGARLTDSPLIVGASNDYQQQQQFVPNRQLPVNPVEQQAVRLREIQQEKEQQTLEMACKMSMLDDSAPSLALSSLSGHNDGNANANAAETYNNDTIENENSGGDEAEISLQYIMDLSRMEAEAHSKAQQDIDRALQVAMERSREESNANLADSPGRARKEGDVLGSTNGDDSASIELEAAVGASNESNNDLELRQSIAELALQATSEHSLDNAEPASGTKRRHWGFRYGRK